MYSSFTLRWKVVGPYPVSEEDQAKVLALAAEAGIEPGHSRWGVDMDEAEKLYSLRFSVSLVFAR